MMGGKKEEAIKRLLIAVVLVCLFIGSAQSAEHRSPAVRRAFVRQNPCPVTGKTRGPCRGYQVDHVIPLHCGGADAVENLQWLTVKDHQAKTKRETRCDLSRAEAEKK
jgi:5-methylcytosine-specific restriction endonuclease McrA